MVTLKLIKNYDITNYSKNSVIKKITESKQKQYFIKEKVLKNDNSINFF
jgi:hypothetical protein